MLRALDCRTLLLLFRLKKFEGLADRLPGAVTVPVGEVALEPGRDFVSLLRCRDSRFGPCPGPVLSPSERGPPRRLSSPEGLGARVDCPLASALDGAVMFGVPPGPLQKREEGEMPDCIAENLDVDLALVLNACFWLIAIAVFCITLRSSFHWATGNRCLAARALISARTLVLEAIAAWIAILN